MFWAWFEFYISVIKGTKEIRSKALDWSARVLGVFTLLGVGTGLADWWSSFQVDPVVYFLGAYICFVLAIGIRGAALILKVREQAQEIARLENPPITPEEQGLIDLINRARMMDTLLHFWENGPEIVHGIKILVHEKNGKVNSEGRQIWMPNDMPLPAEFCSIINRLRPLEKCGIVTIKIVSGKFVIVSPDTNPMGQNLTSSVVCEQPVIEFDQEGLRLMAKLIRLRDAGLAS